MAAQMLELNSLLIILHVICAAGEETPGTVERQRRERKLSSGLCAVQLKSRKHCSKSLRSCSFNPKKYLALSVASCKHIQIKASLSSWFPCAYCGISEAITKTIASTGEVHIPKLLKAKAGNSCFCTFIILSKHCQGLNLLFHLRLNSVLYMRLTYVRRIL